jgi:hypothetical protein
MDTVPTPSATLTSRVRGTGGNLPLVSSFSNPVNQFSAPVMEGGLYAAETATVLYALAVNDLIRRRSEILSMRIAIANGADIWALPGDRVQVVFNGVADTLEAESLGGSSRVTWLAIDRPMLVVERHDKSDASGVRRVEFVLACPVIEYAVPALPEWTDPVALPVPGETGIGNDGPGADWLADTIKDIITSNKLPFPQCCPDPSTDITRGVDLLPPPVEDPYGDGVPTTSVTNSGIIPEDGESWGINLSSDMHTTQLAYFPADAVFGGGWTDMSWTEPGAEWYRATFDVVENWGPLTWRHGTPTWSGTIGGEYRYAFLSLEYFEPGVSGAVGAVWHWEV